MLKPEVVSELIDSNEPMAVKISHNLFINAQYSSQRLQRVNKFGKTMLFDDKRSNVVIADRGKPGGSKYRYLIEEHERLRRVKMAQSKL